LSENQPVKLTAQDLKLLRLALRAFADTQDAASAAKAEGDRLRAGAAWEAASAALRLLARVAAEENRRAEKAAEIAETVKRGPVN
jgi:hypothetical protein